MRRKKYVGWTPAIGSGKSSNVNEKRCIEAGTVDSQDAFIESASSPSM
jgi:hypothetical protein